jgi:4-hydroxybenzoyl-CoA reductase subunit beta
MEYLPEFRLARPETLDEVVAARAAEPTARLLAGGTDLIPNMRRGLVDSRLLIDLNGVDELRRLETDGQGLSIGAAVTLDELAGSETVRRDFAAIAEAAQAVAGPTQRLMGTVGGNLCLDTRCLFYNQSQWWRESNDFCLKYQGEICHVVPTSKRCYATYSGDLAAGLLLFDAEIEIASPAGRRRLALADLYTDDGADHLTLGADELVVAVHLPPAWAGTPSAYAKIRVRQSIDFPLAGVAAAVAMDGGSVGALRLALTGTNSAPVLIDNEGFVGREVDEDLLAEVERLIQKRVSPVRTTLIQPQYRRRAIAARARRLVHDLAEG